MQDAVVPATRAQERIVPSYGADATVVTAHCLDELIFGCIPNLEFPGVSANCKVSTISGPLNRCHSVVGPNVTELGHFAVVGRPEVDAGAQADGKDVLCRPVNEIKIEIVLKAGGVEHFKGLLGNYSLFFVRLRKELVFVEAAIDGQGNSFIFVANRVISLRDRMRLGVAGKVAATTTRSTSCEVYAI